MDIATGLSSIKSALDLAKGLKATKSLMDNAEVNIKIVELMGTLVDAKEELVEIKSQMIEKDKLIQELQGKLEDKNSVFYEEPFYWKDLEDEKKEGPYCQKCYDGEDRLSRLISKEGFSKGSHYCTVCTTWYGKGTSRTHVNSRRAISKGFSV